MKVNYRLDMEIDPKYKHITLKDNNGEITITAMELQQIISLYEKEMNNPTEPKFTIEDKMKECEAHGFKVKKNRNWLWLNGTDGRYNKKVSDQEWGQLTSKDDETKVLKSLGFQYSSNKMNFYWIGE